MDELTRFVREVMLPGADGAQPVLDPAACYFRLQPGPSRIHRWGIFAAEPIPARRRVIEYTGERITPREAWRRRVRPLMYLFRASARRYIDGAIGGSGAEYVNHSCAPNLLARVRKGRVTYVSASPIASGDELLVDYRLSGELPEIPCRCGADECRGYLNLIRPVGRATS